MTMDELIKTIKEKLGGLDTSKYPEFLAIQINITNIEGEPSGVFYIEIKDGKLSVEPYEYRDRQAAIYISMDNFIKLINKKLDPVFAFTMKKLKVEGDIGKAIELTKLI